MLIEDDAANVYSGCVYFYEANIAPGFRGVVPPQEGR